MSDKFFHVEMVFSNVNLTFKEVQMYALMKLEKKKTTELGDIER